MHNNYYFLRQLSKQLRYSLKGFSIAEVYSQAKNELIIFLRKGSENFVIKAHLDPSMCCLSFPVSFARAGKNSVDLFPEIINLQVLDVIQSENDRSFYLKLTKGFQLLFKMYGNRSNVILLNNNQIVAVFKNNLKQDFAVDILELNKQIEINTKTFEEAEGNYKKLIPTFGNAFDHYLNERNYHKVGANEKYGILVELLNYLDAPEYFIHHTAGNLPKLVLYKIIPEDTCFSTPTEALNALSKKYFVEYKTELAKSVYRNVLQSQITKFESYIHKTLYQLEKLNTAQSYQHIGDLIMANMHLITPHSVKVELVDFFTGKSVEIKLKPTLSPQHNAEKYYKKAKKQQIEQDILKKNIELKKEQIRRLKQKIAEADKLKPKQLKINEINEKSEKEALPYFHVNYLGFEILIGKNAKKNAQLTFGTAKKDDLFLHAKDCPGSHVIVKNKAKQNFPVSVIEKAASFAAFYSKNKHESLCRVLYTPKKYVRKSKGGPPGTVIVDREKVVLVSPEQRPGS